jgi:hypothetical protein
MKIEYKNKIGMIVVVVLAIASVFVFAGCGGDGNGVNPKKENQTPSVVDDGLPPDPGEAGKATIAGIDSDNDGVRDDIQRYIAQTHSNSEKTRAVLTQYAKVAQNALLDADDKELSIQHAEEWNRSIDCLDYVASSYQDMSKKSDELDAVILNTDERTKSYFKYDSQLGGEVFSGFSYDERSNACDFDSNAMAN